MFNSLDIIILIVVVISSLIALNRGFVKEVLSITGWILGTIAVVYLLPIVNPFMQKHIDSETVAAIASASTVLIIFFVIWIYFTANIVDKVRTSKLSNMDRFLGLIFGVFRAGLLVILLNIVVNWMIPTEDQPEVFWESRLYQLSTEFAEPIEKMIPQETKDVINQTSTLMEIKGDSEGLSGEMDNLFDQLAKPQIERSKKIRADSIEEVLGYDKLEQQSLDRLIDLTMEE